MTQKRALVIGISNSASIALGTLKKLLSEGVEVLVATHPNMVNLANNAIDKNTVIAGNVIPCDVQKDEDLENLYTEVNNRWPEGFDYLIHAVAYSNKDELGGSFLGTTRGNFANTLDISAYSLIALAKTFQNSLRPGSSIVTYTFAGSRYCAPNYNIMGVAKAALESSVRYLALAFGPKAVSVIAISAGPIKTMSSRAVEDFNIALAMGQARSVTGENVSQEDVGHTTWHLMQAGMAITGGVFDADNGIVLSGMGATPTEMALYKAAAATKVD